jgi:hypothetical protein
MNNQETLTDNELFPGQSGLHDYIWENMAIEKAAPVSWLERLYEDSFLYDLWSLITSPTEPKDQYISDRTNVSKISFKNKFDVGF